LQPSLAEEPLPPRGFIDDWMVRKLLVYRSPPVLTGRSIPDVIV
jgi:hypothetical protein